MEQQWLCTKDHFWLQESYKQLVEVPEEPAGELQDEFIGFDDEAAVEVEASRPEGSPRAAEEPSTSGRSELPWTRASHRIRSPSVRLHNGALLY